ncbi:bactofilin family protein [Enterobacter chuandaensis]|uniref:bactofilin family protein n=1 Tax=Enterobacter chuandaensis TaxID=2497875 RepID=UPI003FD650C1
MSFFFFYAGLLLRGGTLVAWFLFQPYLTGVLAVFSAGSFILHCTKRTLLLMFVKNTTRAGNVMRNVSLASESVKGSVIAQDVIFDGNISSSGQLVIYGQVNGDIHVKEGEITVMREGKVAGNTLSPVLIVNGFIKGKCCAGRAEIGENDRIEGTLRYATLAVASGGVLVGQAEHCTDKYDSNVIGLVHGQEKDPLMTSA